MSPTMQDADILTFGFCTFATLFGDEITLLLSVSDSHGNSRYLYLNESSFDPTYGFAEISSAVVGTFITTPSKLFGRVEDIRSMGDIPIALTDYGFWDIE